MSWSERRSTWIGVILLLSLAGCGFQFRGTPEFPPQMAVIHIATADRYSPFYRELVTMLRRSDIYSKHPK
jgi:outer membrane lipopolysaccharide assembly protein LptE/RlpB